ncbi:conserved oligomeric Golgi complex component [Actinomortierella ambigua]|nr:conserved oligomeric Golgi complex component [Actinomortierella ambigua]
MPSPLTIHPPSVGSPARERAPDSPVLDPSATLDELLHPPPNPPSAPLDSILLPHQYIALLFPLTLLAGSAFRIIVGDTVSYFSNKRNILNVLFAKNGWGWTSLVFFVYLAVVFGRAVLEPPEDNTSSSDAQQSRTSDTAASAVTATAIEDDEAAESTSTLRTRTRTTPMDNGVTEKPAGHNILGTNVQPARTDRASLAVRVIVQALARWALATAYWWIIVQWFFGPSLFDRIFVISGGSCSVEQAFTSHHCRRQGGVWSGGHDISGHMFLLTHACLFLIEELSVFWNVSEAWNVLAHRQAARYAVYAASSVAALWWWMLLMTSVYYHALPENILGLLFGMLFWACTYATLYKKTSFPSMPDQAVWQHPATEETPQGMETETHTDQDVLYELILNQVPAAKRPMLSTSWSKDYLHRLTSLPASALHNEPAKLREEQLKVERDMSELAFRDYKAFIHVKDAKDEVHSTLDSLSVHVDQFEQHIPALDQAIQDFATSVQPILEQQHVYSAILACHDQLLEVLEIPLLMETCVRNGYYHEALELAAHVQRLVVRYPGIGIIQGIEAKVAQGKDRMLVQLLAQLREPIKLPAALKIVGFLRRMGHFQQSTVADYLLADHEVDRGSTKHQSKKSKKQQQQYQQSKQLYGRKTSGRRRGGEDKDDIHGDDQERKGRLFESALASGRAGLGFSEPEDETPLKMLFLKSRQAYMQVQLSKIVLYKGDSFGYLKKFIDATRDCLYEITSQYRSIFGGEEQYEFMAGYNSPFSSSKGTTVTSSATNNINSSNPMSAESYYQKPHCWTTEVLLADFVTDRIQALVQVLHVHIPQIQDTSALSSLLTQLQYCGANLSRVGVDLRYLVTSLFEDAVLRVVGAAFQRATLEYLEGLGGDGRTGPEDWLLPSQWMVTGTSSATAAVTGTGRTAAQLASPPTSSSSSPQAGGSPLSTGSTLAPQTILMDYPSLAYLTNGLLAALNSLRLLAPLSLARPLRLVLQECLWRVEQGLDDYDVAIFGGRKERSNSSAGKDEDEAEEKEDETLAKTGKASRLDAPQAAAEQRLMESYVVVYQRAVRDYILKCFDEGIYGGLVLHLEEDEDDEDDGEAKKEEEKEEKKKEEEEDKAEAVEESHADETQSRMQDTKDRDVTAATAADTEQSDVVVSSVAEEEPIAPST